MDKLNTLYVTERRDWRAWLEKNFDKEKEIWLVYPKKSSGKSKIPYNDAVEEALCFGWIDSTVRLLNKDNNIQRFSPRNSKSRYSQANKERIKWLLKNNLLHPTILETATKISKEEYQFPTNIINAIRSDNVAWENYQKFSLSYRRIRIAFIDGARKRPKEFKKRLNYFISKTRGNKQIGFGGIEKYY